VTAGDVLIVINELNNVATAGGSSLALAGGEAASSLAAEGEGPLGSTSADRSPVGASRQAAVAAQKNGLRPGTTQAENIPAQRVAGAAPVARRLPNGLASLQRGATRRGTLDLLGVSIALEEILSDLTEPHRPEAPGCPVGRSA
jgi:hypothetical protein